MESALQCCSRWIFYAVAGVNVALRVLCMRFQLAVYIAFELLSLCVCCLSQKLPQLLQILNLQILDWIEATREQARKTSRTKSQMHEGTKTSDVTWNT